MLLVVLNDKQKTGIKAQNAKVHATKTQPQNGDIRITKIQEDGIYVVVFDNNLRGYAFGVWLNDHSVKNKVVEVSSSKMLGKKLVELLPNLAAKLAAEAVAACSPQAQLEREKTIQMLSESIINPGKSSFMIFQ